MPSKKGTQLFLGVGDFLVHWFMWTVGPAERLLLRLGASPDLMNAGGLLLGLLSGVFIGRGALEIGGGAIALAGVCDILDGRLARARKLASPYGKFIDSTLDRFVETFAFLGFVVYFRDRPLGAFLAAAGLAASLLVSYAQARGETVGVSGSGRSHAAGGAARPHDARLPLRPVGEPRPGPAGGDGAPRGAGPDRGGGVRHRRLPHGLDRAPSPRETAAAVGDRSAKRLGGIAQWLHGPFGAPERRSLSFNDLRASLSWHACCLPLFTSRRLQMRHTILSLALGLVLAAPLTLDAGHEPPPPAGIVTVNLDGATVRIWPFTGSDLAGTASDPVNLILLGAADPRDIRAALLSLSGDRSAFGFPNAFPFNCTWSDAIGRHQSAWAAAEGWQGSAIQLQCGQYATLRVHLRLFREGRRTLANAHFEVMIPGTTEHAVLSWAFAESLVTVDFVRSGLLAAAPAATVPINPTPYRAIDPLVLNGLPAALRGALGLPTGTVSAPVPIPNGDGAATILKLQGTVARGAEEIETSFVHVFGQTIPRPFCSAGPLDYLRVDGPIDMTHRVEVNDAGKYTARYKAKGVLSVTPVNPQTGVATGPTIEARIRERHHSSLTDRQAEARHTVDQELLGDPEQSLLEVLRLGDKDVFVREIVCE